MLMTHIRKIIEHGVDHAQITSTALECNLLQSITTVLGMNHKSAAKMQTQALVILL